MSTQRYGVIVGSLFSLIVALLLADGFTPKPELWTDPGPVELVDFRFAAGGSNTAPEPPFLFIQEESGGTSPKVLVRDASGAEWMVKGGLDARPETFVTRLVSALGYYADSMYFFPRGRIENVTNLRRASGFIQPDGNFTYATFELREPNAKYRSDLTWSWEQSPFKGTRELNGLKILIMLVSNWDNKDARDRRRGSNVGVLEFGSGDKKRLRYFVNDWGQSLGSWGRFYGRSQWNCGVFRAQSQQFVKGVRQDRVLFGYGGQHTIDFRSGITAEDVQWLMQYLGRVTDSQIRTGLAASGATAEEETCFAEALRERIEILRRIGGASATAHRPK